MKCADSTNCAIQALKSIIPSVSRLVSPVLQVAHDIQKHMQVDLNFKKVTTSNNGLWQSSLCIDCKTDVLHTENDTTYTFITILKKNMGETFTTTSDHTSFLFQLNAKKQHWYTDASKYIIHVLW